MEKFKDIPWYIWLYQAWDLWSIKSLKKKRWFLILNEKILKPAPDRYWYLKVCLFKKWKSKTFRVHRLIMFTFIWKSKLEVNHKNSIKQDNRYDNLEYCTRSENMVHYYVTKYI